MQTSEALNELAAALAKAQGEMEGAKKDSANPFHKSKYADLASVWTACREPLSKNNLSVVQTAATDDNNRIQITTMLLHTSGQWIRDTLSFTLKDATAQNVGSVITYGRRYGLSAIVGVSPEDDDGEAAMSRGARPTAQAARETFQQPRTQPVTAGKIVTPAAPVTAAQ